MSQGVKFRVYFSAMIGLLSIQVFLSAGIIFKLSLLGSAGSLSNKPVILPTEGAYFQIPIEGKPFLGPSDAPITIIEFGDYECPFCAQAAQVMRQLMDKYPGKIKFVFWDFPLENIHDYALGAALSANCANEQGRYWTMHDYFFAHQDRLDPESIQEYAASVGMEMDAFNECLETNRYQNAIQAGVDLAKSIGVQGTPTFAVNGHIVQNGSGSQWDQIINALLN